VPLEVGVDDGGAIVLYGSVVSIFAVVVEFQLRVTTTVRVPIVVEVILTVVVTSSDEVSALPTTTLLSGNFVTVRVLTRVSVAVIVVSSSEEAAVNDRSMDFVTVSKKVDVNVKVEVPSIDLAGIGVTTMTVGSEAYVTDAPDGIVPPMKIVLLFASTWKRIVFGVVSGATCFSVTERGTNSVIVAVKQANEESKVIVWVTVSVIVMGSWVSVTVTGDNSSLGVGLLATVKV
jgi:hypothetical protein